MSKPDGSNRDVVPLAAELLWWKMSLRQARRQGRPKGRQMRGSRLRHRKDKLYIEIHNKELHKCPSSLEMRQPRFCQALSAPGFFALSTGYHSLALVTGSQE